MKSSVFFTLIGLLSMAANVQADVIGGVGVCPATPCGSNKYCSNGVCKDKCTKCPNTHFCASIGVCDTKLRFGMNCKADYQCQSGKCLNKKCGLLKIGETCTKNSECRSGNCFKKRCVSD